MKPIKKEELGNYPVLQVITGGKDGTEGPWLLNLQKGQWFISECKTENQLWMVKFKFKKRFLLYTNLNMEYRMLVDPIRFSKDNSLVELLDIEE